MKDCRNIVTIIFSHFQKACTMKVALNRIYIATLSHQRFGTWPSLVNQGLIVISADGSTL